MHFIVSSSQLLRHLSSLSGVLNSSNTLPILDNFLFELGPGEAVISASDLETTMTTKLEVKTTDTGAIAVPAKMLLDILKAFPDIPLTFKVDPDACERFKIQLFPSFFHGGLIWVKGCGKYGCEHSSLDCR